ncbi:antitoxin HicB [Rhodoferax sp. 4810]|uniref:Antitoxin HicB n=1 Tax=Thiospirillum jenense TaxID=1653858 RepID=A0A839HES0_9GAMM|nr:antitoxin HicB [Thiospirillum jenense]MBB1078217.1 antitoxin HicB [Rhodoferax jenense]MBB1127353.1 antitoxin HicB [Thiospirillum jenense]
MNVNCYIYQITWSPEDDAYLGRCVEFPALSWLASTPEEALLGIRQVIADVIADLEINAESIPEPVDKKHYCKAA